MQTARRSALAAIGLIATAAAVSTPSAADTGEDKAALRAADEAFMRAYWKGDLEAVVALYAQDAVLLPANSPEVKGRDAIRKYYAADLAGLKPGETGMIVESTQGVSGDLGMYCARPSTRSVQRLTTWACGQSSSTCIRLGPTGAVEVMEAIRRITLSR